MQRAKSASRFTLHPCYCCLHRLFPLCITKFCPVLNGPCVSALSALTVCYALQGELSSKDDTVKELRRWLDQAQGQLQNTQTALHEREAECKTLSADLKAALADLKTLKVHACLYGLRFCQLTCLGSLVLCDNASPTYALA